MKFANRDHHTKSLRVRIDDDRRPVLTGRRGASPAGIRVDLLDSFQPDALVLSHEALGAVDTLASRDSEIVIKPGTTGGLTDAPVLAPGALRPSLRWMIGCRVATFLSRTAAQVFPQPCEFEEMSVPLPLFCDRIDGLHYGRSRVSAPTLGFWGRPFPH